MRIAVGGAHASGKSTLIAELSRTLPSHKVVEEPYYLFVAEGHNFAGEGSSVLDDWLPPVRAAMARLDLVVFVPIEQPDRQVLVHLGMG